jgi:hypothetical protein
MPAPGIPRAWAGGRVAARVGLRAPEVPLAATPATRSAYPADQAIPGSTILVNVLPPAERRLFQAALDFVQ